METQTQRLRIVVKVGTSSLTHDTGRLNLHNMDLLARTLSDLEGMGHEIVLVSSGAIGVGALAAVGGGAVAVTSAMTGYTRLIADKALVPIRFDTNRPSTIV